ncbi:hypothetical protein K2173_008500 [Erythroxylum novogranatense]|uniref:C2H2-type domain-containing protein n=1 Tax=Erythroxylum novogranatense TaxID=1862640 RepID=A0AAV8SL38_9ROSI|nr:hypothetical protein K2173_008500 [Erythroxylum novogranatense]
MPVAKQKALNTTNVMKPEDGNDTLDTIIRQAIGKEPFLSFSRANDSPVHWIQLLNALDQQDLPGWPLLTPLKVQMQKCDKCSREFCSSINYRRHMRVHHRLKKLDKDSFKNRHLLASFWDKLSENDAKEILSFNDVILEEVPGSLIVKSLTTLTRKPGFCSLPQYCLRAGSILLDIIQSGPSRFPLNSEELFGILDDASEKTFLCGAAVSMQKYIFDGEAAKIGLETKNLVACTSFLVEQKLVKAWLADKDAEALRCQKLLVEEEEAAQRRQAEILERKRLKKLRHKEQKAKEQGQGDLLNAKEHSDDGLEAVATAEESVSDTDTDTHGSDRPPNHGTLSFEDYLPPTTLEYVDLGLQAESNGEYSNMNAGNFERLTDQGNSRMHIAVARWSMPRKSQRNHLSNGFHGSQRDGKPVPIVNGIKKWSRKSKPQYNVESSRIGVQIEGISQPDQIKNGEVMIGAISVTLGNGQHSDDTSLDEIEDHFVVEHQMAKKNISQEKIRHDDAHCVTNRSTMKFWRPVNQNASRSPVLVDISGRESQFDRSVGMGEGKPSSSHSCSRHCSVEDTNEMPKMYPSMEESPLLGRLQFSSKAAKAFLAERWNKAVSAEHVKLVLTPNFEPPGCTEVQSSPSAVDSQFSDSKTPLITGPNHLVNIPLLDSTLRAGKVKSRIKPENGMKLKYIPKQRTVT